MNGRLSPALLVMLCAWCAPAPAHADTKQDCVAAYEQTQALRKDARLRDAREQALSCAQDICPEVVRTDCAQWLREIEASLPTVVFDARDSAGRETLEVRILLDGQLLQERIDGKAVAVDPGPHAFRYETSDRAPIEQQVVIREGEKNRHISIVFAPQATPAPPPAVAGSAPVAAPAESNGGGTPILAWALGGVGVAGIGMFATMGILGKNQKADLESPVSEGGCAPNCSEEQVDSVRTKLIVADVSLGVGLVALGVATYLFVTAPPPSATSHASRIRFDARVLPHGGSAAVGARF